MKNAFPEVQTERTGREYHTPGMTLRDYFAAKAIEGFNRLIVDYGWDQDVLDGHAREAYRIADAMIKAREL